jgi:hypothetical protein
VNAPFEAAAIDATVSCGRRQDDARAGPDRERIPADGHPVSGNAAHDDGTLFRSFREFDPWGAREGGFSRKETAFDHPRGGIAGKVAENL